MSLQRVLRLLLPLAASLASLAPAPVSSASAEARAIAWSALRSPPNAGASANGVRLAWAIEGETIEIKGYALPVDRDGDLVYEFMLVPTAGACSHMAQPPPDQVIHVTAAAPYRMSESYEFVSIRGRIRPGLEKTQLFVLDGVAVIEAGYSVGRADVARAEAETPPAAKPSPWGFLK